MISIKYFINISYLTSEHKVMKENIPHKIDYLLNEQNEPIFLSLLN